MTWIEVYNATILKVFGESTPSAGLDVAIRGSSGIIANAHRKIQQDWNYWFMEAETTITLAAGTPSYALPTGFKEIFPRGLRLKDSSTGDFDLPLSPLLPNEAYETFRDSDDEADYPLYYEIFGGSLYLYPTPQLAGVVAYLRYYKYLDRPPTTFAATTDILITEGANAVIFLAASEICKIQEEYQKAQILEAEGVAQVNLLQSLDQRMKQSELNEIRYRDF